MFVVNPLSDAHPFNFIGRKFWTWSGRFIRITALPQVGIASQRVKLLLLLYTAIPPGRGKEYQELKFKCHEKEILGPLDTWPNIVHYSEHEGKALLYLTEYKTASSAGSQLVMCPEDPYFMEILADYLMQQRTKISHSCESDLVFLVSNRGWNKCLPNTHTRVVHFSISVCVCVCVSPLSFAFYFQEDAGQAYDEKKWSRHIYTIFKTYTGEHVSIHTLTSAFITYTGKNSSKEIMDSLALSMQHSSKYQQIIYDN